AHATCHRIARLARVAADVAAVASAVYASLAGRADIVVVANGSVRHLVPDAFNDAGAGVLAVVVGRARIVVVANCALPGILTVEFAARVAEKAVASRTWSQRRIAVDVGGASRITGFPSLDNTVTTLHS